MAGVEPQHEEKVILTACVLHSYIYLYEWRTDHSHDGRLSLRGPWGIRSLGPLPFLVEIPYP